MANFKKLALIATKIEGKTSTEMAIDPKKLCVSKHTMRLMWRLMVCPVTTQVVLIDDIFQIQV